MAGWDWRSIFFALALLPPLYFVHSTVCLFRNYRTCRKSGFPTILMPAYEMNPLWLIYTQFNRKLVAKLPFGLSEWSYLQFFNIDWAFHTRGKLFKQYGDCFIQANPGGRSLFVGDRELATEIFARRQDFPKATKYYDWVRFYGNNVLSTEGHEWQKQRKVTGPPFNDVVNSKVWSETILQVLDMKDAWLRQSQDTGEVKMNKDLETVARNVITSAGFGISLPFEASDTRYTNKERPTETGRFNERFTLHSVPDGHGFSFGKALDTLLARVIVLAISPKILLNYGPKLFRETGTAYNDLGAYFQELVDSARKQSTAYQRKNLLECLVDSSEHHKATGDGLTDEELNGNVFLFALAGLGTTAGTLQYILILMAMHPDVQDWFKAKLAKELDGESEDPREWSFEVFQKLVSPICVINETLRLFTPHQHIPKCTTERGQTVTYKGVPHYIAPDTTVFVCIRALHDNESYWGKHTHEFYPQSWYAQEKQTDWATEPEIESEKAPFSHVRLPLKGSFAPFSEGVRSCLGRTFTITEMAAVLAVLFRGQQRVRLARNTHGETFEKSRERAWDVLNESLSLNTLMIRGDVEVVWETE